MEEKKNYKFKRSESFYIREGWFEKAINLICDATNADLFSKNNGIEKLGIGSNMVKGLRYWLTASGLVNSNSSKTELTEFGALVHQYDKYFESIFSWSLIHVNLVRNDLECPLFFLIFNFGLKSFAKEDAVKKIFEYLSKKGENVKEEYINDDMTVFLKTYVNEGMIDNPEDNYVCPLSYLKLIIKKGEKYVKCRPPYQSISYLSVYYALCKAYENEKSFNIEDSFSILNSPIAIFNLDKSAYLQYLEEMKRERLVSINKTAGLNTVYFEGKKLSLSELFKRYFGGK